MVAGHEHERHVERVHQRAEVLRGQVTAGHDQLGRPGLAQIGQQPLVHLVGDGEHADPAVGADGPADPAGPVGGAVHSAHCRFADIQPVLPEGGFAR